MTEAELKITGKVQSGCGGASRISEEAYTTRCLAAGQRLVRGTLNITVGDLNATLTELGAPHFICDGNNPQLGDFRWWRIRLESPVFDQSVPAFMTRSVKSKAQYLEIMSTSNFRNLGIENGASVSIIVLTEVRQLEGSAQPENGTRLQQGGAKRVLPEAVHSRR